MSRNGNSVGTEEILAQIDENHRVYLCEFGIVHLKWRENDLVFCPGDFIGLPFLLSAMADSCKRECVHGELCPYKDEDGIVYLPYHSVRLPFSVEECRQMHRLTLTASKRLCKMREDGFFTRQ